MTEFLENMAAINRAVAPLYKCPRCGEYPGAGKLHTAFIIANDGGSVACCKCGCLHHVCIYGDIKLGSPGPLLCPHCAGTEPATVVAPVVHAPVSQPDIVVSNGVPTAANVPDAVRTPITNLLSDTTQAAADGTTVGQMNFCKMMNTKLPYSVRSRLLAEYAAKNTMRK